MFLFITKRSCNALYFFCGSLTKIGLGGGCCMMLYILLLENPNYLANGVGFVMCCWCKVR